MSAYNFITIVKRTSLNVYGADILIVRERVRGRGFVGGTSPSLWLWRRNHPKLIASENVVTECEFL